MRRVLCPVESLYVGQRSRAVLSCVVRGRLDTAALSEAFDLLTSEQPTLRARIVPHGSGHALELLGEAERPRLTVRTAGDEVYDEELNTPLPVGGPLSRAVVASAPGCDRHLVVISVDHTVTDGHSALTLQNTLWDHYRDLVEGRRPSGTSGPVEVVWPRPVSELLPPAPEPETAAYLARRLAETERRPVELVAYDAPGQAAPEGGHRIEVRRLLLDEDRTARLRDAARRTGTSVHGLVAAAVLTVARARLDGEGHRTLGCLSPVDLRARLDPPVDPGVMVAAVTTHLQTVSVAPDTDPSALARGIGTGLREAVARGDHLQDMRITPHVPAHPVLQKGTVIVTNMGAVRGPRLPAGLQLDDVRLAPAREQYFPQAGRSPVMACVVTFDGRLGIEFPHHTACFSRPFMRAFRDDVRTALLSFPHA